MSMTEALSKKPSSHMWKFLNYLGAAIGTVTEDEEDLMEFVVSYMKTSSISAPIKPHQYMEFRAYTNGTDNMAAKTTSREDAGDLLPKEVLKQEEPKKLIGPKPRTTDPSTAQAKASSLKVSNT